MIDTFLSRKRFSYGIPSLDKLLQTKAIPDSFLEYDEQILVILKAAGIPGPEAYATIKAIKKKKADKIAAEKKKFKEGFTKVLQETEGASETKAHEVVEQIWTIIENAANYMFCAAHAFSMACDSLYVAWLKVHYPYELYATMLKLYSEKRNTEKIANIIAEMKRYKNIRLTVGSFGQDNRDWFVDRESNTISQDLTSIKHMSDEAAEDLYQLGLQTEAEMGVLLIPAVLKSDVKKEIAKLKKRLKELQKIYQQEENDMMSFEELAEIQEQKEAAVAEGIKLEAELKSLSENPDSYDSPSQEIHVTAKLDCFTNVLRAIQMNSRVNSRQIKILTGIGYFNKFGKTGKLMKVYNEFFEGKNALSKGIKSFDQRLEILREYEASLPDEDLPVGERLQTELDNVGLCLSVDPGAPANLYFVENVDDKYGIKIKLYSVQRGTSGIVRVSKKDYAAKPLQAGLCISMVEYNMRPRYSFRNGEKTMIPGEKECWVTKYIIHYPKRQDAA